MKLIFKNRPVVVESIQHGGRDPVDSFIDAAYYEDTGAMLTDSELNDLTDQTDLYIQWFENQVSMADAYMDYLNNH